MLQHSHTLLKQWKNNECMHNYNNANLPVQVFLHWLAHWPGAQPQERDTAPKCRSHPRQERERGGGIIITSWNWSAAALDCLLRAVASKQNHNPVSTPTEPEKEGYTSTSSISPTGTSVETLAIWVRLVPGEELWGARAFGIICHSSIQPRNKEGDREEKCCFFE